MKIPPIVLVIVSLLVGWAGSYMPHTLPLQWLVLFFVSLAISIAGVVGAFRVLLGRS